MKLTLKILKLFAILFITASALLFSASLFLENRVADIILNSLNRNVSTKLNIGSSRLTFLRKFPNASLVLKDVLVYSSPDFNPDSFKGINTDTLLNARSVSVDFKITDIIRGIYNIERISAKTGKINFYTDTAGRVNYIIKVKNRNPTDNDFAINLKRINLSDIDACYNNLATRLLITGLIKNGRIKSRISGEDVDFTAGAEIQISTFQLYNTTINKPISSKLGLVLKKSDKGIVFKNGSLKIENYDFGLNGTISSDRILDLNITGNNIDLSNVKNYLPEKYFELVSQYSPSGKLFVKSKVKGLLSRTTHPHVEINWLLKNGQIKYGKSDLSLKDLSFAGNYSNGSGNCPETSSFSIRDLTAQLGSAEYTGSFTLNHFVNPTADLFLKGKILPEELKEFFNIAEISTASGSFDFDVKVIDKPWPKEKIKLKDIIDLKPEANLIFNSFSIGLKNDKFLFNRINGKLSISSSVTADNLKFVYKRQQIAIDGEFNNLPEWLAGKPVKLIASADVTFGRLIPESFLNDSSLIRTQAPYRTAFTFPDDVILDINFKIDTLDYKSFSSSKITGAFNYKPGILTFKSLNMESLNGTISGNGFIVQNSNKSNIARGNFNVSDIDIHNAFTTFHNFGQDFLKSENITGNLSGTFSLLLPMDSMMKPQIKTVNAEGKYTITDGKLINFDPVKRLSSFIALSELENINFDKLENDFFIRNNFLYTPQMDVRSSAADLSLNGKHNFDNDYEYHIKILLSEMLSRKRKKKTHFSEFGVIEDDGVGRTSMLLKIEKKGKDINVTYDMKAAGNVIKNNIKTEKQTLKTILNQEYGWFKNDTVAKQKPANKKPRFNISWSDDNNAKAKAEPAPAPEKKKSAVKVTFDDK
ncbi:MAG: AsmA-like C-terminal region-containing protein [Bacteroidales bacterium]|nr:AsmA-like C-terminal region-containing protein [Bacteroidales bacterium]